jgi:hypothetical protein
MRQIWLLLGSIILMILLSSSVKAEDAEATARKKCGCHAGYWDLSSICGRDLGKGCKPDGIYRCYLGRLPSPGSCASPLVGRGREISHICEKRQESE